MLQRLCNTLAWCEGSVVGLCVGCSDSWCGCMTHGRVAPQTGDPVQAGGSSQLPVRLPANFPGGAARGATGSRGGHQLAACSLAGPATTRGQPETQPAGVRPYGEQPIGSSHLEQSLRSQSKTIQAYGVQRKHPCAARPSKPPSLIQVGRVGGALSRRSRARCSLETRDAGECGRFPRTSVAAASSAGSAVHKQPVEGRRPLADTREVQAVTP